jgi:hypothetical protein
VVATVGIVFVRHDGGIRSIETDRLLRHPAHPCNTLSSGASLFRQLAKLETRAAGCSSVRPKRVQPPVMRTPRKGAFLHPAARPIAFPASTRNVSGLGSW